MTLKTNPPTNRDTQKVIVGMSGGVDSSVAAHLLIEQGYQVEGLFMKNWDEDDGSEYCTAITDLADAQSVCDKLGIHLHSANFAAEYWDGVFEHFLAEYKAGRTPNPDVLCNREIKFKAFLEYAQVLGADKIATGHYSRNQLSGESTQLLKAYDNNKDQSYFLHQVGSKELSQCLFPLGELTKPEVRIIAQQLGLSTHNKKDSTGICFIGERRFKDFLQQYLPAQPGAIETPEGKTIGDHQGLMYHTLGQRQGLGIGGLKGAEQAPWYVVDKDLQRNVLIVAQGKNHQWLFSDQLIAGDINWIGDNHSDLVVSCQAKVRYRQTDQSCRVSLLENGRCQVNFNQPQRAVTPGQSVVFYSQDRCLGGGVIESYSKPWLKAS